MLAPAGARVGWQYVQVCRDPVDPVKDQRSKEWGDTYGTSIAVTLRLLKSAGATKTNKGNRFADGWFVGVPLVEAMEIEFPGWSITGILKNNAAGFPHNWLQAHARSTPSRIRKAGFNAFMHTTTKSGLTGMLAVGHEHKQDSVVVMLSTAGDCKNGQCYTHRFTDSLGKRHAEGVSRPEICVRFYRHANVIDNLNRHLGHELALTDRWPVKQGSGGWAFWKKTHIHFEATFFLDFYMHMRTHKKLESMLHGATESVLQFLDRFIGKVLAPAAHRHHAGAALENPAPVSVMPLSGAIATTTGKRGVKRNSIDLDGQHGQVPCTGEIRGGVVAGTTPKKFKESGGTGRVKAKVVQRICMVCKSEGTKVVHSNPARCPSTPLTSIYCGHCQGFVHGRNDAKHPTCWVTHLNTKIKGLAHSGDNLNAR